MTSARTPMVTPHNNGMVEAATGNGAPRNGSHTGAFRHKARLLSYTLAAFIICVAALTFTPSREFIPPSQLSGTVSNSEIRASFFFQAPDLARTEEAQAQAQAKVPDHYVINAGLVQQQIDRLQKQIQRLTEEQPRLSEAVRQALNQSTLEQTTESVVEKAVSVYATSLKTLPEWSEYPEPDLLALWLTPDLANLPTRVYVNEDTGEGEGEKVSVVLFTADLGLTFTRVELMGTLALDGLEYILTRGIRPDQVSPEDVDRPITVIRGQASADTTPTAENSFTDISDNENAEKSLSEWLTEKARQEALGAERSDRWARIHDGALALATPLIIPTIQRDESATEEARQLAIKSLQPVLKEIEAGEIIQDRGKRWTKQSRSDVEAYLKILESNERPGKRVLNSLFAHGILVLLVFWGLYKRVHLRQKGETTLPITAFNLALLLLSVTLIIGRIIYYFEPTGYVLPVAAGGILYAILVGPQRAALFGALAAALVSAQYQYNWRLLLVAGAMTIAGAFSTFGVRRRSDMTAASLVATLAGILAVGAAILALDTLQVDVILRRIFMILLNGLLCLLAVPALLPWLEKLFGITTDIQLLEYSDLNHPLLRRLAVAAPATFAHSLQLGLAAEAAADAIGANGLLARVCAYYHDIGKQNKPEYFTENQSDKKNIHDSLSPLVSVRMIRQHVIEGVREAQLNNLPQPIIDGILEHHGTCRIGFFYDLFKRQNPGEEIDDLEFRYPGPKPQRPEMAILMICDASESAARSLETPSLEAIQEIVTKIIHARSEDNQFEDCDLTLKQLSQIRDVTARVLASSMHTRIAYPKEETLKDEERQRAAVTTPALNAAVNPPPPGGQPS